MISTLKRRLSPWVSVLETSGWYLLFVDATEEFGVSSWVVFAIFWGWKADSMLMV